MRVVLICVPVSEFTFVFVVSATQWSVLSKALSGPSHGVGQQRADLLLSSLALNLKGRTSLPPPIHPTKSGARFPISVGSLAAGQTVLRKIKLDMCLPQTLQGVGTL